MTLTAVPSKGCSFEQWSGDIGDNEAGNASIGIVMDKDHTIFAGFAGCAGPLEITVNASIYSSGSNTINTSFGSLTWNATQTITGTAVNVSAVAAKGYRFDGWSGAVNGSRGKTSFVADSTEPVTARFSKASSHPWTWVIIGIATVLVVVLFIYRLRSGRAKRPKDAHTDVAGLPQPQQPQPPQNNM